MILKLNLHYKLTRKISCKKQYHKKLSFYTKQIKKLNKLEMFEKQKWNTPNLLFFSKTKKNQNTIKKIKTS